MKQIRSLRKQAGFLSFIGKIAAPLISGVGSLIGGSKSAKAATTAANTQVQSGQQALAQNQQFFDQTRSDLSPYRSMGEQALTNLGNMNMTQPNANYSYNSLPTNFSYNNLATDYNSQPFNYQNDPGYQFRLNEGNKAIGRATSTGALPSGGATLKALTRFGQDYASNEYGNAYNRFSNDRMFDYGTFADNYARQSAERGFDYGNFADTYNRGANERNFDYGVFGDNYNRQATNMDRPFNYNTTLASMGQNAANMGAQSAGQFAGMNSQTITGMGNAKAAGTVGSANAWNQALGQIGNTAMDTMTLRTLMNGRNMNSPQNSGLQYFDTTALPSRRY